MEYTEEEEKIQYGEKKTKKTSTEKRVKLISIVVTIMWLNGDNNNKKKR